MQEPSMAGRWFIPLSGRDTGNFVEVSEEDFVWASRHKWRIMGSYPAASINRKTKALHRLIMGEPLGLEVDHIDGNRLNARRDNLRICTRQENACNRKLQSGFKGVSFRKTHFARGAKPWRAYIKFAGKEYHLGFYWTEAEAASAYNQKALELFGDFARLNPL